MKASKMIEELSAIVDAHGDLEVSVVVTTDGQIERLRNVVYDKCERDIYIECGY